MRPRDHGEWDQIAKTLEGADDEASKTSLIGKNAAIPRNLQSFMMSENAKSHGCIDAGVIPVNPRFLSSSHHLLATFQDPSAWPVCEEIPWHQVGLEPRDLHSDIPWLIFFRNPRPLVERVLDDHFPPEPSAESFAVTKKVPKT